MPVLVQETEVILGILSKRGLLYRESNAYKVMVRAGGAQTRGENELSYIIKEQHVN